MYNPKLFTRKFLSLFVIVLLFLSSCEKESEIEPSGLSTKSYDIGVLKAFLSELSGEPLSDVTFENGKFTIGGDIVMPLKGAIYHYEKSLTEENPSGRTEQRKYTTYVTLATIANVKVNNAPGVPIDWAFALGDAAAKWNASDSKVHIEVNSDLNDWDILVGMDPTLGTGVIAQAEFPANGFAVGGSININPAANSLSYSEKVAALTHELGHTFGFMHTDQAAGTLIPDTPVLDPASIMNHAIGSLTEFSFYDQVAIASAYPRKTGTRRFLRYYSSSNTDHFYTIHPNEMGPTGQGWVFEGGAGYIFGTQAFGTVPLYRYYDAVTEDHFYTMNFGEVSWTYEGIAGYVSATATSETRPLYRYFNTFTKDHFYTVNHGEVSGTGWDDEGIACYVW